jgi:2,4-dienoyl-CoA reductase-like NADH-dependent reductase (Old Yellow Enzyme family)/thioredoxin reductase
VALYDNLFEPIDVGRVTIKNRIVRSPHGTGLQGESLIAYHEARAKGGVGMSTIEATGVHASAPSGLKLYSDDILPFLEELSGRIRPHGMKMFHQLYHGGASNGAMPEAWSASAVPNPMGGMIPMEMTKTMIDDVVAAFGTAARRVRDGGLDGVDIHASSGYLIHEFLSPALNKRTDEYGGSEENRLRFLLEVIDSVRDAVGSSDFAVGVRLPNEDYVPGGVTAELSARIAGSVDDLVDYVSLHMGAYWRFHKLIAPADEPLGVEMEANKKITPAVTKPTIVVGRIMTLDHASHIVGSGEADMVSMVRALIADPELVNKARRREEHKIRPCIGSNMGCVGQLMTVGRLSCVVNVAAGKEDSVTHEPQGEATQPKKLLVVGGGPAGLEFARTAAIRGHQVELHEAMKVLGGQVTMAAAAPNRGDLGAIVSWLVDEVEGLGVDVHLNSMVDADLVAKIAPDEVIVATGTTPRSDGFQISTPAAPILGSDLSHVYSSWDLFGFGDITHIEGPAVVFDDTGSFEAISASDVLLKAGVPVTLVSRAESIGQNLPFPGVTAGAAKERLMSGDFDFVGGHYVREINPQEVEIGVLFTERSRRLAARTVVLVGYNEPNRELAEALDTAGYITHMVGDVRGRNSIMSAIHAASALGRSI